MIRRRVPASLAQHAVWRRERMGVAAGVHHLPLTVRLEGHVDADALRAALAAVVARHPALDTAFEERGGVLFLARPASTPVLDVRHLATVPMDRQGIQLEAAVAEEIGRPFDLRRGPLLRLTLIRLAPERSVLLAVAHHLVFDEESKEIFVNDLARCYRSAVANRPRLATLPSWHADQLAREHDRLPEARAFWRTRWREPASVVGPGFGRWAPAGEPGGSIDVAVVDDLRRALAGTARALGVTRFVLLLSALHSLLQRYGNARPAVAVDLGTRIPETRGHIGLFLNQLPVAPSPGERSGFGDLARATRDALHEVHAHRDVPLAHAVSGDWSEGRASLLPVSASYRRRAGAPDFGGPRATVDWTAFGGIARSALHLQIVDEPGVLRMSLQHGEGALPHLRAAVVAGHYLALLQGIAGAPDPRGQIRPRSEARPTACIRLRAPSLASSRRTWNSTVFSETWRAPAISEFVRF